MDDGLANFMHRLRALTALCDQVATFVLQRSLPNDDIAFVFSIHGYALAPSNLDPHLPKTSPSRIFLTSPSRIFIDVLIKCFMRLHVVYGTRFVVKTVVIFSRSQSRRYHIEEA